MIRYPDWVSRLEAYYIHNSTRKFEYGAWDCCLSACGAIEAMTGIDPASEYRGKYHTRGEAITLGLVKRGYISELVELLTLKHKMPEVTIGTAQRGDLIMNGGESLLILSLDGRNAYAVTDLGACLVNRYNLKAPRAWAVGR